VKINHQFTPKDGLFCKHRATPELICGYPRASHPEPVDEREKLITDAMRETGESREIVTEMLEAIECCASEGASEALAERRQAAREAFCDEFLSPETIRSETYRGLEMCVEVATRVQVTPEIVAAGSDADSAHSYGADYGAIIIAAFRAAGFEVVE
jgi:hypothetical protein